MLKLIIIVYLFVMKCCLDGFCYDIDVENLKFRRFPHFWRSTGFCPPDAKENIETHLLSNETKMHISLIGSLPNRGITHIRIHWLLNLLHIKDDGELIAVYFENLDTFLSILHKNKLYPGFEFMGIPNKVVHLRKDFDFWSNLSETLATRYYGMFGNAISKWRFETWNEPDLKMYNVMNFSVSEFLQYVSGCAQGLRDSSRTTNLSYKLGGPAGLFRDQNHPLCWSLLDFCSKSITRCPVNFLSFHRKGNGTAQGVLNGSVDLLEKIYGTYLGLKRLPIGNDEADMETNWSKSLEWRADTRYAAMVVKVVAGYYKSVVVERKLKIEVLSNDNAFLNYHPFYFTQRTLFARYA